MSSLVQTLAGFVLGTGAVGDWAAEVEDAAAVGAALAAGCCDDCAAGGASALD
jgi:hypothetical protein